MTITPSPIEPAGAAPSSAAALWAPLDLFRAEWSGPVRLSHAFETSVAPAATGAEQRRALRAAPVRSITLPARSLSHAEATTLASMRLRLAQARSLTPIITDQSSLSAPAAINDTTILCDTADRLFTAGGRAVLMTITPGAARSPSFEIVTIASVASGSLTIAPGLTVAFAAGARVAPLMESDPAVSINAQYATGDFADQDATFRQSPARGAATLAPAAPAGVAPAGAAVFESLAIFDVWPDFSSVRVGAVRADASAGIGFGRTVAPTADRAARLYDLAFTFHDRATARRLLAWFEAMRGRALPFWFVSPAGEIRLTPGYSFTVTDTLDVEPIDWDQSFALLPEKPDAIAVVDRVAGVRTPRIARIVSAVSIPANGPIPAFDRLTLDRFVSLSGVLDRISFAHIARFADDELTEEWVTTEHMRSGVRIMETLREAQVEVGLGPVCPPPPPGVTYDCTPASEFIGAPPGNYRLADSSTQCPKAGQPKLYIADGAVVGAGAIVVVYKGVCYQFIATDTQPIFTEQAITADDAWITSLSQAAFLPASEAEGCIYLTCRDTQCPGGVLILTEDLIFNPRSQFDCTQTIPACPATTTFCFQTASLVEDRGCPTSPNSICSDQQVGPPECFARECVYSCFPVTHVSDCG